MAKSPPMNISVTWTDKEGPHSEPFTDICQAITRATDLSKEVRLPIFVETQVRYLFCRFENGEQKLERSRTILPGVSDTGV